MGKTFVIAESGATWESDLKLARRSIEGAKAAGADAWKAQWTSNPEKMAARRGTPLAVDMYAQYLAWPQGYIPKLKAMCNEAGIEFMCTVYLIEDIGCIAPYVQRFKISAFEGEWREFVFEHPQTCEIIVSSNPGKPVWYGNNYKSLYCVSKYPCPVQELGLSALGEMWNPMRMFPIVTRKYDGLSDHTTSILTGALAVAAGARIVEKHIRLSNTVDTNPDYPHSLIADWIMEDPFEKSMGYGGDWGWFEDGFQRYVLLIRQAELAMGVE